MSVPSSSFDVESCHRWQLEEREMNNLRSKCDEAHSRRSVDLDAGRTRLRVVVEIGDAMARYEGDRYGSFEDA